MNAVLTLAGVALQPKPGQSLADRPLLTDPGKHGQFGSAQAVRWLLSSN